MSDKFSHSNTSSNEKVQPLDQQINPMQSDNDDKPAENIEIGGRNGPDPTRFGDWEKNGRCIDF